MKKELHLMIIWKNALEKKSEILNDLKKKFKIRNKFMINWSNDKYSSNLSRFYGTSLPDNSFKEQHCGKGEFLLVVFEDLNPLYDYRETSHGNDYVNVNIFEKKCYYREITGGKGSHLIHATNSPEEFNHDITLLLGVNKDDFIKKYPPSSATKTISIDVVGANGWKSINEIFYTLNNTNNYVVLRDFENDLLDYIQSKNNNNPSIDIDILSDDRDNFNWILNIKYNCNGTSYVELENDKIVYFDVKDTSDGYYFYKFANDIISNKKMRKFYYTPNLEYHYYSCLYHALIHKFNFQNEYNERLEFIFGKKIHNSKESIDYYISICSDWLLEHNYLIDIYLKEPKKFNVENIKKFSDQLNKKDILKKYNMILGIFENENAEILELKKYNKEKEEELIRLYNSKSWKITKPLRLIRKKVNK